MAQQATNGTMEVETVSNNKQNFKWYQINATAIPAKVSFLCLGLMEGSYEPYLNLFLIDSGLTTFTAGLISGIRLAAMFLGSLLLGMLTDWTQKHQMVILVAGLGAIGFMLPQPWILSIVSGKELSQTRCLNDTLDISEFLGAIILFWQLSIFTFTFFVFTPKSRQMFNQS